MALNRKTIDDDIDSLCAHLGLDPTTYHHFSNDAAPSGAASPVQETDNAAVDELPAEPTSLQSAGKTESQSATPAAAPVDPKIPPNHALAGPGADLRDKLPVLRPLGAQRWPSLRGIGGTLPKDAGLNVSPVAFQGIGGGVGLTTVLATTAKALAMLGQRVLVADDSPRSTLPYFFGAHDLLSGNNSLIVSDGVPTYLLMRDPALESDTTDEWLWQKAAQLDRNIDGLLMEASSQMAARTQTWVYSMGLSIFVLEPDMRSVMALPKTLELFAARQERFTEPIATYFLLNKYDETSSFNVDMRHWLQDELGGMLAPVVLRRDYRVSEALAQGKTVLDYAPASEISGDFHLFAQWLRSIWKR